MTEERMRAKENKEIDLIDLIIEVLLHWRGLIIALLVGGLVLGGYSVYTSYKAQKAAKLAASVAEEEKAKVLNDKEYFEKEKEKIEKRLSELEGTISAKDEAGANQVMTYREQLEVLQDYKNDSVLMKADAKNLPTGVVTLRITSDQVTASVLENSYKGILSSAEMFDYIKQKIGYGNEIAELITINSVNNYNNNNTNVQITAEVKDEESKEIILVYNFIALTEEDSKAMEDAFIEFAKSKVTDYQSSLGTHNLIVVDKAVSTIYNANIENKQIDIVQKIATLENNITTGYDALTDGGKEYCDLLIKQMDMESEMAENMERAEDATVAIPPITVNKKKLLIGLVGGFFAYAFILCLAYIFSRRIKDSDDFDTTFGVNQLGKIYGEFKSAKRATGLDKAIYSLKRRGRKKVSFDEASSIIAVNTSLTASKGGYKKLGLITSERDGALTGKISEALKAEGVEGVVLSEPLYNGQEMSALKDIDAAVIIVKPGVSRYDELWDIIEVLDNQKVKILGGVMG